MEKTKSLPEDIAENRDRHRLVGRILDVLDVAVAYLRPEEVVDRESSVLDAVGLEDLVDLAAGEIGGKENVLVVGGEIGKDGNSGVPAPILRKGSLL